MSDDSEKDKRQHRSFKAKRDIESPNKHHTSSLETQLKDLALETVSQKNNESQACQQSPDEPRYEQIERDITYTAEEISKRQRDEGDIGCFGRSDTSGPQHYGRSKVSGKPQHSQTQPLMGLVSAGCSSDIVRSGHIEFDTLWASNDVQTNQPTINVLNAPNSSTLQCGCENITCPFCNLMLSIEQTDPTVLK